MQLFFRKFGDGSPLTVLHGIFGSSDNWCTLGKKLAENFTVYLLDLRNHGRSPHSNAFSSDVMVGDLKDFFIDHNLENASVLGHSLGGGIAMKFVVKYPQMVQKLIVVDFAPKKYRTNLEGLIRWLLSWDLTEVRTIREADQQLASMIPDRIVRRFILKNLRRKSNGKLNWKINLEAIYNNLEGVSGYIREGVVIENPSLFIRGGKSDYIKPEDIYLIRHHFSNVRIETIPEAGHWTHADAPKRFLDLVNDFIL
jgi:pimeloyl-ACP methyl ester carboxylesterase